MRIAMLLLHDMLTPSPDIRVQKEADTLARAGHEVAVFCWDRAGTNPKEEAHRGFRVVRVGPPAGAGQLPLAKKVAVFRKVSRDLVDATVRFAPQAVHAHDFDTLPAGAKVKARLRVPLVYDSHEDWPELEAMHSRMVARATAVAERRLLKRVDHVITIGDKLANKFRRAGHDPLVLFNAPRAAEFPLPARDLSLRKRLGFRDEEFVIVISGSVFKDRGDDVLQDAMRGLGPAGARLLTVGGSEKDLALLKEGASRRGISSWCVFTGHVPAARVPAHLSVADAGVLPFKRTKLMEVALGNKAFEFLAAGLPVLASDLGELRETLGPTGAIGFAEPGDADSLGDALRVLMSDPARRMSMGQSARAAFEKLFAWEHQEAGLVELYEGLAAGWNGGGKR
jgi:glycosyltransferase involved in cell wall biosynthesis